MSRAEFAAALSEGVISFAVEIPLSVAIQSELLGLAVSLPPELERAAPKRQSDYLAGRYCARKALQLAGYEGRETRIATLPDRAPRWPEGWVGSITHAHGFAAAAVAKLRDRAGLGIDTEKIMSPETANEILASVLTPLELERIRGEDGWLGGWSLSEIATLVFSAKESVYKCLRPLTGVFFGFQSAEITRLDPSGHFEFRLLATLAAGFEQGWKGAGSFARAADFIHTAVELKRD